MTKKVFGNEEEEYAIFELTKGNTCNSIIISDRFLEEFNKLQEWAEEMRDYVLFKKNRAFNKNRDKKVRESGLKYVKIE